MTTGGKRFALVVTALGIATLVTAAIFLRDPILESWWLRQLQAESSSDESRIRAAKKLGELRSRKASKTFQAYAEELIEKFNRVNQDGLKSGFEVDARLQCLFQAGVLAYPEVFEIWIETCLPEVLLAWQFHLDKTMDRQVIIELFPGVEMSDDRALELGGAFSVSWAGHQLVFCNPIPAYEKLFGLGSWPKDLPLERLRDPRKWKRP